MCQESSVRTLEVVHEDYLKVGVVVPAPLPKPAGKRSDRVPHVSPVLRDVGILTLCPVCESANAIVYAVKGDAPGLCHTRGIPHPPRSLETLGLAENSLQNPLVKELRGQNP